jgi:hypothetical protein
VGSIDWIGGDDQIFGIEIACVDLREEEHDLEWGLNGKFFSSKTTFLAM